MTYESAMKCLQQWFEEDKKANVIETIDLFFFLLLKLIDFIFILGKTMER